MLLEWDVVLAVLPPEVGDVLVGGAVAGAFARSVVRTQLSLLAHFAVEHYQFVVVEFSFQTNVLTQALLNTWPAEPVCMELALYSSIQFAVQLRKLGHAFSCANNGWGISKWRVASWRRDV